MNSFVIVFVTYNAEIHKYYMSSNQAKKKIIKYSKLQSLTFNAYTQV